MKPANIGLTYWPIEGRTGKFLFFDRVAEQDGWAWMRVIGPWRAEEASGTDSQFNAGFTTYSDARRDMPSFDPSVARRI
ncbi:hypothetical protein [Streptomyces sp. HC307]|uniref:hypothetical protein n=1 Tax=Streptomyces flavusporus TaxID=3385496 RepID=UPI003916D910